MPGVHTDAAGAASGEVGAASAEGDAEVEADEALAQPATASSRAPANVTHVGRVFIRER